MRMICGMECGVVVVIVVVIRCGGVGVGMMKRGHHPSRQYGVHIIVVVKMMIHQKVHFGIGDYYFGGIATNGFGTGEEGTTFLIRTIPC